MASTRKKSPSSSRGRRKRKAPDTLELGTDKLYFKIGEVAEIAGVEAYVLRYWETEFKMLRPQKSRARQRVYRRKDVETILRIKHLLYERRFTIAGARQELEDSRDSVPAAAVAGGFRARQSLGAVREQLDQIWAVLKQDDNMTLAGADPAEYVRRIGGARALVDALDDEGSLVHRPERENA